MFCTVCGAKNNEGAKFCESCGQALTLAAAHAAHSPPPPPNSQLPSLNSQLTQPPPANANKGNSRIWIPITAVVAVLVVAVGALWLFTDVLPWTDKSGGLSVTTIRPPIISNDAGETENSAGTEADAETENSGNNTEDETENSGNETEVETHSPSFSLPLPDNLPASPAASPDSSASPDPTPSEAVEIIMITPLEARDVLQTWLESHPFQLGAMISSDEHMLPGETQGEPYREGGDGYYRFYVGIIRLGVASILVHQETGELFHLESPYSSMGFAPIDDRYYTDHAAGAPPLSAYDAWVVYDVWMESHWEMSDFKVDLHSYDIYEVGGDYYYWFRADNTQWYWYNVLVNMQPGEMLFMMIPDGEESEVEIELLEDYYNRYYG